MAQHRERISGIKQPASDLRYSHGFSVFADILGRGFRYLLDKMTPQELARRIQKLRPHPPITTDFERTLSQRGGWSGSRYASQKQHWLRWLSEYQGPGFYGRKEWRRSAQYVYNHIVCPPMVIWLAEASGIPKARVVKAKKAALSSGPHFPAQCAAIRKTIAWEMIETRLGSKPRRKQTGGSREA
jgi:hypothetical protein